MANDFDLNLDIEDVEEYIEPSGPPDNTLYDKSLGIIKEAMKDVKQEILIKLEDGTDHIVYVTELQISGNGVSYGFSTPSEDRKAELTPHVERVLKLQLDEILKSAKHFQF
jgi:hypothetical protein